MHTCIYNYKVINSETVTVTDIDGTVKRCCLAENLISLHAH